MVNEMQTCLVTGGAGFIGSWLCDSLVSKDYRVVCIDNLVTGREENIGQLKSNKNFRFVKSDVSKQLEVDVSVDFLFHLASPASPVDYQKLPIETMMANSLGTMNSLNLAKEKGSRFLQASTSEVYGDPKEHPQRESYWGRVNPLGPRSCYDESKRFAEALTMAFKDRFGLDTRIARIFNTYGPRMRRDDGRAIPNFITQALEGRAITVYGDGKQTRSFCYISDMVEGLERLMFKEGLSGEVFNIGNPEEYTILEIAEKIKSLTKSSSNIVFRDLPKDDPTRRKPDVGKARDKLGWEGKINLINGIKETIKLCTSVN
jgi:nucleoside-diphosphate-sugar epimerase